MKRWILAALAAASLFSTAALADTPVEAKTTKPERHSDVKRYADTAQRWRGRPALRSAALAHPADESTASEVVYEFLPSANFMVQGQNTGAFPVTSF